MEFFPHRVQELEAERRSRTSAALSQATFSGGASRIRYKKGSHKPLHSHCSSQAPRSFGTKYLTGVRLICLPWMMACCELPATGSHSRTPGVFTQFFKGEGKRAGVAF